MDLRRIRTFVTVAELGTVSKAAEQLHVAQPALSRHIASLEDEFGVKLFDRVGRRIVLTSEGEQLLSDCHGLLNSARALGERAQMLRRGDVGVLRVSTTPHLIEGIFPDFLRHFAKPTRTSRSVSSMPWAPRRCACSSEAKFTWRKPLSASSRRTAIVSPATRSHQCRCSPLVIRSYG